MSRIQACFNQLKSEGRKGLIPYITAGDHSFDATVGLLHTMVSAGANIIELGVPFSDPVVDGPVIEKAHHRAVANGVTLVDVLSMVDVFRKNDKKTPVVLMSYLNPIEMMGYETFAKNAKKVGVDGLLVVDCPPEESKVLKALLAEYQIDLVYLIAPNTPDHRIKHICDIASGYIYYVSFKGVTGASNLLITDEVQNRVNHIRKYASIPICVGFGVKNGETAATLAKVADAVIVGTALVKTLAEHDSQSAPAIIERQIKEMRSSMDA